MTNFKMLAKSSRMSDKIVAAKDLSCPANILDQIILSPNISWESESGKILIDAISLHPNCPSEHLSYIFENRPESLQLNVLQNPGCPIDILDQVLAGDNSNLIQIALQHPECRKRNREHWRTRLRRLGKEFFELDEMVRLGFVELDGLENLEESYQELTRLKKWKKELNGQLDDFEVMLKKVHSLRIERIQKKREKRIKEKESEKKLAWEKEILRKKITPTYLGSDVSKGLEYDSIRKDVLKKSRLPIINNAGDLAKKIGITSEELAWLSYHRKASTIDHYVHFTIPKRKGGYRTISSPKPLLRQAQRWVLEKILTKVKVNSAATGFVVGKSIVDNARVHQRKKIVLRIDLKDFFPSIKFNRVKGMFHSFGYSEGVSTILGLIATESERKEVVFNGKKYFVALDERRLPQGACTSPAISNIISRELDSRLYGLGGKLGWDYTRYADDIVFSTKDDTVSATSVIKTTQRIIFEEGFLINDAKTMVMRPHQRQIVTGIVVNNELKISRRDIRKYRAFLHQYKKIGKLKMTKKIGRNADAFAKGYLSFINMVNDEQADKLTSKYKWLSKL